MRTFETVWCLEREKKVKLSFLWVILTWFCCAVCSLISKAFTYHLNICLSLCSERVKQLKLCQWMLNISGKMLVALIIFSQEEWLFWLGWKVYAGGKLGRTAQWSSRSCTLYIRCYEWLRDRTWSNTRANYSYFRKFQVNFIRVHSCWKSDFHTT